MEYFLTRCVPVLLDDSDSIGSRNVFDDDGGSLPDSMNVSDEVIRDIVNVLVMFFWNDQCVPLV